MCCGSREKDNELASTCTAPASVKIYKLGKCSENKHLAAILNGLSPK